MDHITFRPAKLSDLPLLLTFEQGIIQAERPYDPTFKADPISYYDIEVMIEEENTEVLVALCNDTIIGAAYVKIKEAQEFITYDAYAYVGFMFVQPEHRGKGISKQILEQLKRWAQSKNLTELRLEVYEDNNSAVKAYEKFGLKKHLVEMRMKI